MNTKEKGDIAVGNAIRYFISNGYEVCLPIGDKRHYDLIVEKGGDIKRVQVKFAGINKRGNQCLVGLRITGGNQSYNYSKKYDNAAFDTLFVYTERSESYVIPWEQVLCRNELTIEDKKYKKFIV